MMKGSDKMHIKKLASTLMKKNLIVTFTVVTAISLGILTGCGAYQQANADPLTNPTQIEQMVEEDGSSETTDATTHEDKETACEHVWETVTEYTTEPKLVHHEAEDVVVVDKEAWDEQVVDKAAWDETIVDQAAYDETTYTTETTWIHHDEEGHWERNDEIVQDEDGWHTRSGEPYYVMDKAAWDEEVTTQVPHTTHHDAVTHVVHHDATYRTVHHDAQTHTETIAAYDEEVEVQVPHTVERCTECGEEKK